MAATIKVLMTADTLGGAFTAAVELAAALSDQGVQIALATLGGPLSPAQRRAARKARRLEIVESRYRLEWMDDPWDDVERSGRWLLEIERRIRPDVIELGSYAHGALPFSAPKVIAAHSCALSFWRAVGRGAPPASHERYRREVGAGLAGVDAVVTPTATMLRTLATLYRLPPRARVIPITTEPHEFRPSPKEDTIVTVGGLWDPAKNIAALGDVASLLPWPIYAAGSTVDLAGERRPIPGLLPLGVLERAEVASVLSRAAIFALPARYEVFGLSTLEAALSGCALVLGDIPALRELWGSAAIYVPPDDRRALLGALDLLIAHPELRAANALQARARALAYAPERSATARLGLYAELLQGRPRTSRPPPHAAQCA